MVDELMLRMWPGNIDPLRYLVHICRHGIVDSLASSHRPAKGNDLDRLTWTPKGLLSSNPQHQGSAVNKPSPCLSMSNQEYLPVTSLRINLRMLTRSPMLLRPASSILSDKTMSW